jgi:hypothetical protein
MWEEVEEAGGELGGDVGGVSVGEVVVGERCTNGIEDLVEEEVLVVVDGGTDTLAVQ